MTTGREVHHRTTIVLSTALIVLGVVILVRTVGAGAGAEIVMGYILGVLLIAAGVLRLYVVRAMRPPAG